jgi:hypothetical protein
MNPSKHIHISNHMLGANGAEIAVFFSCEEKGFPKMYSTLSIERRLDYWTSIIHA